MGSPLTTHVLDIRLGKPAAGMVVELQKWDGSDSWEDLAIAVTNADGRVADFLREGQLPKGTYQLKFSTAEYFVRQGIEYFYPEVTVEFNVTDIERHYHVPLLLSPFGYSTYRGS